MIYHFHCKYKVLISSVGRKVVQQSIAVACENLIESLNLATHKEMYNNCISFPNVQCMVLHEYIQVEYVHASQAQVPYKILKNKVTIIPLAIWAYCYFSLAQVP